MAAPTLQPITIDQPLGTPAAEWAQQTVEAIDPNASTGVVTDVSGNPTTNKEKSALGGEPGHGINANKTGALLEAQKIPPPASSAPVDVDKPLPAQPQSEEPRTETTHPERPQTEPPKLQTGSGTQTYTDKHGNPTTDPSASALSGTPGAVGFEPSASSSVASTPGAQLPGGWIRGPESRQNSILIPETSLYEDVSAALGTVGQAAFSVLPASVVGSISNNPEQGGANPNATQSTAATTETTPPPRSGSPGLLSRAQGMLTGLLARPGSPGQKLPAPDAPTTTGGAALVGGGAVAETANQHGENIASGQDLGGHNPKGVLEGNTTTDAALVGGGAVARTANEHGDNIAAGHDLGGHDPKGVLADDEQTRLEKEASGRAASPLGANTAANFLNPKVSTPDPTKPPQDPGVSGSVFPVLADDPKKNKKGNKLGSSLSPDTDVQEAASRSNQDFSVAVPDGPSSAAKSPSSPSAAKSPTSPGSDTAQPKLTKVSDSGVKERLLDAKDVVVAPFAGSRAPRESDELARVSSDPKRDSAPVGPVSANPEGVRTAANPHTAHTGLPPPREEAGTAHVGGTSVLPTTTKHKDSAGSADAVKDLGTTRSTSKDTPPTETSDKDTGNGSHIPGISTHGDGQGKIHAHEDGGISTSANGAPTEKTTPGSPNKGVSRLWSRSRRSVDEGTTSSRTKSRFSEHEPSTGSDSPSAPGSPTSSRFKVPLKDKIKGEIKIISGKVSRNEAKVEQGIALKTGQSHLDEAASPTGNKH